MGASPPFLWKKTMKTIFIALSIIGLQLLSFTSQAEALCLAKNTNLGAKYSVTNIKEVDSKNNQTSAFEVWRKDGDVFHIYPAKDMSIKWHKLSNGDVRKVSHFDHYQRSIEFEPTHSSQTSWSNKYQLISEELLSQMTLLDTEGSGCEITKHYQLNTNGTLLELWWQPEVKLARKLVYKEDQSTTIWQLKELTFSYDEVAKVFIKAQNYQSTDYADIGDNESDPFLRKMIHLGFVEHGSGGFYDDKGNQLKSNHHH